MELTSKEESVIVHYKGDELVAITHYNGTTKLLKVSEMLRKDISDFYEINKV